MHQRCRRQNQENYARYGGKGVRICARWYVFENFLADMGERPEGTTLDRKESSGDYTPDNCRWSDAKTQSRNRSYARQLTCYSGPRGTKTIAEWADISGTNYGTIRSRLRYGWTHKEAVFGRIK